MAVCAVLVNITSMTERIRVGIALTQTATMQDVGQNITTIAWIGRTKMSEYVNKQELIEKFKDISTLDKEQILYLIGRLETVNIESQRWKEVTRCMECKKKYMKDMAFYCNERKHPLSPIGYCEKGERE